MPILIMTVKSPKVKRIMGRESNLTTGRIKELTIPRTIPAIKKSLRSPLKTKPGTNWLAVQIAAALAVIWISIFI
jgi:hypothetical protein